MQIEIKSFSELNCTELYTILQLRSEVFVVEQNCVYQDIDGKDQKAIHILGIVNKELVAYLRIFKPGDYFENASIGRVVVHSTQRKKGFAKEIMEASITFLLEEEKVSKIELSAQLYLEKFYKDLGFKPISASYLEDGIPHIRMVFDQ